MVNENRKEENNRRKLFPGKKWKIRNKKAQLRSHIWFLGIFCNFLGDRGSWRGTQTADMASTPLRKKITCAWSEKEQKACESHHQYHWDMRQLEIALGPTVTARETFSDPNDLLQESGLCLGSTFVWGQRWILGECHKFQRNPIIISDKSGKGFSHAKDVAHGLFMESDR
ncbi:hypothetical protein V6N13_051363 [Hibiscus sabdariffa]|uniref:Uncharacterized protein n=1 Tax=Hibiscus sabdariffa TaxID=183260 RepID=A0ABR2T3L6_9ROSI